jgi:hypothetical protein
VLADHAIPKTPSTTSPRSPLLPKTRLIQQARSFFGTEFKSSRPVCFAEMSPLTNTPKGFLAWLCGDCVAPGRVQIALAAGQVFFIGRRNPLQRLPFGGSSRSRVPRFRHVVDVSATKSRVR